MQSALVQGKKGSEKNKLITKDRMQKQLFITNQGMAL